MKHYYFIICFFIITTSIHAQIQDTIYFWKAGQLVLKQSIKPADLDSITFKRQGPAVILDEVTICSQIWATKNLDVTNYRNGDEIPQVTNSTQWAALTTGAWCYYGNDPANGPIYGKLYNWYAINDPRGLAPIGWHIPTDNEWQTLADCLGGILVAGSALKEPGTTHWNSPNTDATNSSGFTALPGGSRGSGGPFSFIGNNGYWWSSSQDNLLQNGLKRSLTPANGFFYSSASNKKVGFSVRCLKD